MSLTGSMFYIVAALTLASALGVAASRSIIRSAVWLLFTLIGVSLLYLLLGAEFISAAQMIVYVGGTMVLVVFGVMLTSGGPYATLKATRFETALGLLMAIALGTAAIMCVGQMRRETAVVELPGIGALGLTFLGVADPYSGKGLAYLLPFEIVSIHLLVVLIAAAYLARAKQKAVQP
jgi:NADH-quinone oxidoreductase subunit J